MTTTELRPVEPLAPDADLAAAHSYLRRRLATSWASCSAGRAVTLVLADVDDPRLDRLRQALVDAERGGATVVRIEHVRAIVGATAAELGGA